MRNDQLVRFHGNTAVMRLDMDQGFSEAQIRSSADGETREQDRRIFEALDYVSHDQRAIALQPLQRIPGADND
ncbi:hypothetical protein [Thiocapsa marina]|uniref:Uncharacterized protein n=1 Tax=Thiocapsa marina 5811 TaxID=768671 RepID=F9UEA2_9GAMM|nr:hypothetical protein [Thiocapsa marina]EGV17223.1 hypothetical protein ThimaDRAFT_3255 [Thiocapsa marina 5811]